MNLRRRKFQNHIRYCQTAIEKQSRIILGRPLPCSSGPECCNVNEFRLRKIRRFRRWAVPAECDGPPNECQVNNRLMNFNTHNPQHPHPDTCDTCRAPYAVCATHPTESPHRHFAIAVADAVGRVDRGQRPSVLASRADFCGGYGADALRSAPPQIRSLRLLSLCMDAWFKASPGHYRHASAGVDIEEPGFFDHLVYLPNQRRNRRRTARVVGMGATIPGGATDMRNATPDRTGESSRNFSALVPGNRFKLANGTGRRVIT